ncbi:MAG: hypothetical protein E3K37_13385 [Candidatus Kuenenia sp.]|nr:hypothetical protein [Candidatus Kuenenia hertensis]
MRNRNSTIGKNLALRFDNIIIGLIVFLLFAMPLTFDRHLVKPFSLCKLVLFYGAVLFIIAIWLMKLVHVRLKTEKQPYTSSLIRKKTEGYFFIRHAPMTYPVLAYMAAVLLSTIFSLNKTISIFGNYVHYEGLFTTIGYIIFFFATLTYCNKQHIFYIAISISIVCFLSSLYGIIQFFNYDPFLWVNVDERLKITSTFGNPVFFSGYIVTVFPLVLVTFLSQLRSRFLSDNVSHPTDVSIKHQTTATVDGAKSTKSSHPKKRENSSLSVKDNKYETVSLKKTFMKNGLLAFLCITLIFMLFNLYITKTRGAWLGFIFSIICVMVLLYMEFIVKHRVKVIISVICFMVVFGIFAGYKYKHHINQLLSLIKQTGNSGDTSKSANKGNPIAHSYFINTRGGLSILYRVIQYKSAIDMIRDYPLTGIGPDLFSSLFPQYSFRYYKQSASAPEFENVLGVHNDILDKATTCGIIGLGTYLWIFGAYILYVKRYFYREKHNTSVNVSAPPPFTTPTSEVEKTSPPSFFAFTKETERGKRPGGNTELLFAGAFPGHDRLILSGLLACVAGYLVQQQFNVIEYPLTLHFWIFLAAGAVLLNPVVGKNSPTVNTIKEKTSQKKQDTKTVRYTLPSPLHYLCYLPIAGFLAYGLFYLINIYRADIVHKTGSDYLTYATTYQESGNELKKNPYWEKGLKYYKTSVLYNPGQTMYRYQLCEAYLFMLRKDLHNTDLIHLAIKEAEEVVRINPYEDFAFHYLANAYDLLEYNTGRDFSDIIISASARAMALNPHKPTYYDSIGVYYIKKGFYEKAIHVYKQLFHMKSDYPRIDEKLTSAYKPFITMLVKKDLVYEAEILLNEIQSMPHNNDIYFKKLRTIIYAKRGMWNNVIGESEQILLLKSDDIDARQNIATAYYVMKRYEDAKKMLEKIIQLSSNFQPAHDLLQKINARSAANSQPD